jgi:hypothetical protein
MPEVGICSSSSELDIEMSCRVSCMHALSCEACTLTILAKGGQGIRVGSCSIIAQREVTLRLFKVMHSTVGSLTFKIS